MSGPSTTRVMTVGGGFAGLFAAKALKDAPFCAFLIDWTNHQLFEALRPGRDLRDITRRAVD